MSAFIKGQSRNKSELTLTMKIPVGVIGFGLFILGSAVFGQLRSSYLRQASDNVSINPSQKIVLRYAVWAYIVPLLGFGWAAFFGHAALSESNQVRLDMDIGICIACLLGGAFVPYRIWAGRIEISDGKLVYTEGSDFRQINVDDVSRFSFNGISFLVKRKSERITGIPAAFEHSEIILAFLKQATANK